MAQTTCNRNSSEICDYQNIANRKIEFITAGLQPFIYKNMIQNISSENALKIAEYILAMKTETNISDAYRSCIIRNLSLLSRFYKNKPFTHMRREDILSYLDNHRKPDALDPLHQWIGTYNLKRTILIRFFKWFQKKERQKSAVSTLFL